LLRRVERELLWRAAVLGLGFGIGGHGDLLPGYCKNPLPPQFAQRLKYTCPESAALQQTFSKDFQ
jgi:hypothetical protein